MRKNPTLVYEPTGENYLKFLRKPDRDAVYRLISRGYVHRIFLDRFLFLVHEDPVKRILIAMAIGKNRYLVAWGTRAVNDIDTNINEWARSRKETTVRKTAFATFRRFVRKKTDKPIRYE